jgi:drug/metabolite transporter superfamily protein YnfA
MPSTKLRTMALLPSDTDAPPCSFARMMPPDEAMYYEGRTTNEHPTLWPYGSVLGIREVELERLFIIGGLFVLAGLCEFGRVYAAYGGIFIALSLIWGIVVDEFRPDRWDLLGASICVIGVLVMVAPPRG